MASRTPNVPGQPDPIRDLLDEQSLADEISRAIEGNDCPHDAELGAFVRQELAEPERIEIKSHLTFCSRCQKRLEQLEGQQSGGEKAGSAAVKKRKASPLKVLFRRNSRQITRGAIVVGALALVISIGYTVWSQFRDTSCTVKLVSPAGEAPLRVGQAIEFEIKTYRPVYVIQITIDGDGRINPRIAPGPHAGVFEDGDHLVVSPHATGELDVYLVPCPASEGFPNQLLNGLNEFLKTESALSRENQRTGIETALGLYRARFQHHTLKIQL